MIELTEVEVAWATKVGTARHASALAKGSPDAHGASVEKGLSLHIEGACGELAVAKALGRKWEATIDTYKSRGDVGDYEVRTRSKDYYGLLVRRDDRDEATFICVTGRSPRFIVRGWLLGAEAKQPAHPQAGVRTGWWDNKGGREWAWFAPQSALHPLTELRKA